MLGICDHIVACSRGLGSVIADSFPGSPEKVVIIHNGSDIDATLAEAKKVGAWVGEAVRKPYIVCIGTFIESKGQGDLIRSFSSVAGDLPDDMSLVLVGRDGPARKFYEDLIGSLHLGERVKIFCDLPHDKCMGLLANAEFLAMPSHSESFSVVLLEAAALGKAVVATDVCGVTELISDRSYGIVVEPGNSTALAAAISDLVHDPEQHRALGPNLNRRLKKNFSWQRCYQKYVSLMAVA
jgi:glycosyltransferase involved in cell wall biosynthesis